jgi:hypothetical protein
LFFGGEALTFVVDCGCLRFTVGTFNGFEEGSALLCDSEDVEFVGTFDEDCEMD